MLKTGHRDILETVAVASAGDPGCCGQHNSDGRCCMTRIAREIFQALKNAGGPSLEQCEAIAQGRARLVPVGVVVTNRDELHEAFELIDDIEQAVQSLPYRDAHPLIAQLNELRDMLGESLPGGYYGKCNGCGEIRGHDEMAALGDIDFCQECVALYQADPIPADRGESTDDDERKALIQAAASLEAADV